MESTTDTLEPFLAALLPPDAVDAWTVNCASSGQDKAAFLHFRHVDSWYPDQGWKLHISSTGRSIETMLVRAMAVLLPERAVFKVIGSRTALNALNQGQRGLEQVGKCLTVYPRDDSQAVRLAGLLVEATRGLRGPEISTDRRVCTKAPVYYRYGAFSPRILQLATGEFAQHHRTLRKADRRREDPGGNGSRLGPRSLRHCWTNPGRAQTGTSDR